MQVRRPQTLSQHLSPNLILGQHGFRGVSPEGLTGWNGKAVVILFEDTSSSVFIDWLRPDQHALSALTVYF